MNKIFQNPYEPKDFGEDLGEFEGIKLKGIQPYWNELKVKGL